MTCIIAIETATEACSAALLTEEKGEQSLYKRFTIAPREHTKLILPMLDEVLAEANMKLSDVDAIAFGRGPGAFTGLRIATGIAQGLALSVDKKILPISSLEAMALAAKKHVSDDAQLTIIVAIDARMGEVYWAEYKVVSGNISLIGDEQVSHPGVMFDQTYQLAAENHLVVIGSGWDEYIEAFKSSKFDVSTLTHLSNKFPDAEEVAQLALIAFKNGECQSIESAQPVYLRNNVAEKSRKK